MLIEQGDWNAKIGRDAYDAWKGTIGKFGLGHTNDRGKRLLEFTKQHKLVIANTLFKHKLTRIATWHSPGHLHDNQIDFILVSKGCQSGINGAKTRLFTGVDVGSDHDLFMMTMKIKLARRQRQDYERLHYDIEKLKDPTTLEEFRNTLGGKFAPLLLLDNIQDISSKIENAINGTAKDVSGTCKKQKRHPWVTTEVLQICSERRTQELKRYNSSVDSRKYKDCNKRVRKKIKEAKELWIKDQCTEIEQNTRVNNIKKTSFMVKTLTRKCQPKKKAIKDKDGILARWKEYCEELYNHEVQIDPETITMLANKDSQHHYDKEPPILEDEVIAAIEKLNNNKLPGTDNITAELLKAGGEPVINILYKTSI